MGVVYLHDKSTRATGSNSFPEPALVSIGAGSVGNESKLNLPRSRAVHKA